MRSQNKKAILFLIFSFVVCFSLNAQFRYAKEWSKDLSVYNAKDFLIKNVLDSSLQAVKFSIDALAASKSGELTTVVYDCDDQKKHGLIFGFWGNYWLKSGVEFKGYGFKNFTKEKGLEFLNKLQKVMDDNDKYLRKEENGNVYFYYDDVIVLLTAAPNLLSNIGIRVFWGDFDADWDIVAFSKTKRRLLKSE